MTYDDIPEGCFFHMDKVEGRKPANLWHRLKVKRKTVLKNTYKDWSFCHVRNPRWFDGSITFKVVIPKEYC